jgi:hypothetical protein
LSSQLENPAGLELQKVSSLFCVDEGLVLSHVISFWVPPLTQNCLYCFRLRYSAHVGKMLNTECLHARDRPFFSRDNNFSF